MNNYIFLIGIIILILLGLYLYILNNKKELFYFNKNTSRKKNIYFVIQQKFNHKSILTEGSGASESIFYFTVYELSKIFNLEVYHFDKTEIIDGLKYNEFVNNNDFIKNINDSIVVVQRNFQLLKDLYNINSNNKYILWTHDLNINSGNGEFDQDFYNKNNITIVAVSKFHVKNIMETYNSLNIKNVKFIYNGLFPEYFIKYNDIKYDKNKMIFVSDHGKGLDKVINICNEYYNKNKDFKLILLKPSYANNIIDTSKYPFIENKNTIKNKNEYSKLLQNCLFMFSSSYRETFGCAFTEALHLGVPVLGDLSVDSAIRETTPPEYLCDFNNTDEVIKKIEEFKKNRPIVHLDKKFYKEAVIQNWKELFESL